MIVEKVVSENVFNSYTEHIVSLSNAFLRSNKSFICNPSYSNAFRTFLFVLSEHLSTRLFVGSKDSHAYIIVCIFRQFVVLVVKLLSVVFFVV